MKRIVLVISILFCFTGCRESTDSQNNSAPQDAGREKHRPVFHFTPPRMWMNDPNGMVYLDGEYHLFYQHYPDSTVWGPMHWGHAVSQDLFNWEHLPIALYPDSLGYIFSGSAVFDRDNTSGFGSSESPPLVAIYTYHSDEMRRAGRKDYQTQGIAFSIDKGRTWKKYAGNPVLKNPNVEDFRDPKVFWHEETQAWIMILAVRDHVELYSSKDLKQWNKLSEFGKNAGAHGGVWECPDLFQMTVEGQQKKKWVMLVSINPGGIYGGSATQYFVGEFNGKTFSNDNPETERLWVDYGKDNYAGVTWSNVPKSDGRTIFLGWMSNWQYANVVPTESWRSAMSIPRTLHLQETGTGLRLASRPVKELANLRKETYHFRPEEISGERTFDEIPFDASASEIVLECTISDRSPNIGIRLSNDEGEMIAIGYESSQNRYYIDRTKSRKSDFSKDFSGIHYAPRSSASDTVKLHLVVDVASVELFADDGTSVITDIFFPQEVLGKVGVFVEGGSINLVKGQVTRLALSESQAASRQRQPSSPQ